MGGGGWGGGWGWVGGGAIAFALYVGGLLCGGVAQYADAKRVIAKLHKTRSDANDYINAVVVPLLKQKATAPTGPTAALASALLGK
jgi:hypothetical protein